MAGAQIAERRVHGVRWLLTTGWLLIIGSLFFDPFTARFTAPDHPWSPLPPRHHPVLGCPGAARVEHDSASQRPAEPMRPGQVLDELEVLSHSASESTIVAESTGTRVLAVPVDSFDATLERDPEFARRVLELESRQLQRLTREASRRS